MGVSAMRTYCSVFDSISLGWYYFGPRESAGGQMAAHPTRSAFVRASTLSLGSIAFGSLIVALLEILRLVLQALRNNANADGHRAYPYYLSAIWVLSRSLSTAVEACLACCAECFVGCIESMVEYFNRYAVFHLLELFFS